jgi:hypothetical protein
MNITHEAKILRDESAPLDTRVLAAAKLWNLIDACEAALKPFMESIRTLASETANGATTVTFEGAGLSQCKVVLPGPSIKLREGLSVEGERNALGELFNTVYEVKLSLRNASPAFIATLPLSVQTHLAGVTALVPATPRVSLKLLEGVEQV